MTPNRFLLPSLLLGLLALAPPALAAPPESAQTFVRSLYEEPIYNPLDEGGEQKLTGDALAALKESQRQSEEGEGVGCIDFVVTVSGQDWDGDEVRRTLKVEPAETDPERPLADGEARVLARFRSFAEAEPAEIVYDLFQVNGDWRIGDITNTAEEGWTMSQLCAAQ